MNHLNSETHTRNMASIYYAGLRPELTKEVRLKIGQSRTKGNEGWGEVASNKRGSTAKTTVTPIFSMFTSTDERFGRSNAYHADVAAEMIVRHELGMSLWANDGDVAADTDEDCVGVELNRSELDMMDKLIEAVQSTSLASQRK
mgnify:FL=1